MAQVPYGQPSSFSYKHISTQTTTIVKATPGVLRALYLNSGTSGAVITLFDNATVASGTSLAIITLGASVTTPQVATLQNINFVNGLTVLTATQNADLTFVFS